MSQKNQAAHNQATHIIVFFFFFLWACASDWMLKYQIYWRRQIYNEDVICALRQWNTLRGLHTQAVCLKLDKVKCEQFFFFLFSPMSPWRGLWDGLENFALIMLHNKDWSREIYNHRWFTTLCELSLVLDIGPTLQERGQ